MTNVIADGKANIRRRRRMNVLGVAALVLCMIGGGSALYQVGGSSIEQGRVNDRNLIAGSPAPSTPPGRTPDDRTGPLPDGPGTSCVEQYGTATLPNRAFAFDGTVQGIRPSATDRPSSEPLHYAAVTFAVNEWFFGGEGTEVTVDMGTPVASDGMPAYAVGSRLLVSGEPRWGGAPLADAIAWGCGFSRYYDNQTANAWRTASNGKHP